MRSSIIRAVVVIIFVGAIGTAAAKEYYGGRVALPEGCASPASCGALCAERPSACVDFCSSNSANAVECSAWAKANREAFRIAQFDGGHSGSSGSFGTFSAPPPPASFTPPPPPPGDTVTAPQPTTTQPTTTITSPSGETLTQPPPIQFSPPPSGEFQPPTTTTQPPTGFFKTPEGLEGFNPPPEGFVPPPPFSGEQGFPGAVPGEGMMHKPSGIHFGGGVFGAGPQGCTSPEECKKTCEDPENKQKCDGFFGRFQGVSRGFEQQQGPQDEGEFEAQRKSAEEQMLRHMKQGMQQMGRMLDQMKRRVKSLERRKVKIPEEITASLAQIDELRAKMEAATSPEEIGEFGPQMAELVQDLNESFGDLERLAEFPRMRTQSNRMIQQFERQYKRLEARAKARKIDVTEELAAAKALLEEMKAALKAAEEAVAQGDAEEAFENLQAGVFERGDEVGEKMFALEIVAQAPQQINRKNREIRLLENRIRQKERQKVDVTEAKDLLVSAKVRFEELKKMVRVRPLPIEELMSGIEEFEDMMDQVRTSLGDEQSGFETFKPFELELPEGVPIGPTAPAAPTGVPETAPVAP